MTERGTQNSAVATSEKSLKSVLNLSTNAREFEDVVAGIEEYRSTQLVHGLTRGMDAFLLSALFYELKRPILVICNDSREASRVTSDLMSWAGEENVAYFPPADVIPDPDMVREMDPIRRRLQVITRLIFGEAVIAVGTADSLLRRLPPRDLMEDFFFTLDRGDTCDRDDFIHRLIDMGYTREEMVADAGQIAARGGIVDVFPPTSGVPVRIEFFGDEIDSIRYFEPGNQRSIENVESARLGPARETFRAVADVDLQRASERMEEDAKKKTEKLRAAGNERVALALKERIDRQLEQLCDADMPENFDVYTPYFCSSLDTIFDYMPRESAVALWDPRSINRQLEEAENSYERRMERLTSDGVVLKRQLDLMIDPTELEDLMNKHSRLYMTDLIAGVGDVQFDRITEISGRPSDSYYGQWETFLSELETFRSNGKRVVIATDSEGRAGRLRGTLRERNLYSDDYLTIARAPLSNGFEFPELDLIVLTEKDIFGGGQRVRYGVPKKQRRGIKTHEDLAEGDYVVHRHHGIGKYLGLSSKKVQGVERDYLVISYAQGDRLFVPVDAIDLVQKYVGKEGKPPKIHRLGSGEWKRVKKRVRKSLRDMAEELMQLYSARQSVQGHAFSQDTAWQREFEDSFPFEETPDQLLITDEIKSIMEKPRPMDYLLCGDVGFGKTEVAMRAVFKALMDGKQVAFLVPTTILAQQHYTTARERLADWPVKVDVLSRFRSKKEQEETITGLRRGTVDMVIGTHRLLQDDVQFRNLGLVVVDEEHRFGVEDKENLKQLKQTVDVLTLSATPIPRTLHMALSGIRDMNVIETPPEDRLPVSTYVMEFDGPVIADAIRREIDRGGQVFYVHNRVNSINAALQRVQRLVPEARVAVAHGQMAEAQLEAVMDDFIEGNFDVLVCTTIIESGLDIPNANTLIIEDADKLGLAQLYQIRGRVGRSDRLAYCYLTYKSSAVMSSMAAERLNALREFTDLGSGFRLAKRDLELRGAGNVLGAEQHGHMIAVGFDLYTKMLREEIEDLSGERKPPLQKPAVELNVDAYLPDDYVPSSRQRISLYRKINNIDDPDQMSDILDEMIDRFGDPPKPAVNLVYLAGLAALGAKRGVLSMTQRDEGIVLEILPGASKDVQWEEFPEEYGFRCLATRRHNDAKIRVHLRPRSTEGDAAEILLQRAQKMLTDLPAVSSD